MYGECDMACFEDPIQYSATVQHTPHQRLQGLSAPEVVRYPAQYDVSRTAK
jgi:hypothetical protein